MALLISLRDMKIFTVYYDLGVKLSLKVFVRADTIGEALTKVVTEFPGAQTRSIVQEDADLI